MLICCLQFKTSDYVKYGVKPELVESHMLYLNLYPEIAQAQQLLSFKAAVRCNDDDATVSNILTLTDQVNKQAGVYQADKREPLDAAITEIASKLLGSRIKPTITGDDVPRLQSEMDNVNDGGKGEGNQ